MVQELWETDLYWQIAEVLNEKYVNEKVKHRENFRPFTQAILKKILRLFQIKKT